MKGINYKNEVYNMAVFCGYGEPDAVDIINFNVMVAIVTTECEITTMGILASLK